MSNTVTFLPSTQPTVDHYLVQSAVVFAGPYSTIATIANTFGNPGTYNTTKGFFYFLDAAGTLTTWYVLIVVDNLGQQSPPSAPFQVGSALPARARAYTTDSLLSSVKLRAMLPTASNRTFSSDDFLAFATEEMRNNIVPAIISERQDYYTAFADFDPVADPTDSTNTILGPFPLPYRCVGMNPKLVQVINSSGKPVEVFKIDQASLPFQRYGFYFLNNAIYVKNTNNSHQISFIRVWFQLRTNQLVQTSQTALVEAIDVTRQVVTLDSIPNGFAPTANYDFIKSNPGFDVLAYDQQGALSGNTLSFASALPANIQVGDQVSLADQSAVIQLPVEFHAALAQAVACRCLEAEGDRAGLAASEAKFERQMKAGMKMCMNRSPGNPKTIVAWHSPYRNLY